MSATATDFNTTFQCKRAAAEWGIKWKWWRENVITTAIEIWIMGVEKFGRVGTKVTIYFVPKLHHPLLKHSIVKPK